MAFAFAGSGPAAGQNQRVQLELSGRTFHAAVCPRGNPNGTARCFAHVVTDARGNPLNGKPTPNAGAPSGFGPAQLEGAYQVAGLHPSGSTPVIAIVDAYGYSKAESDLATYRSQFGLPACTTANGCFKKVDQKGGTNYPREDTGWAQESALDLDMASAMCPDCKIVLVEAASNSFANLTAAVNYAKTIPNVRAISNSYGGSDSSGTATYDSTYSANNIAITVSSGDSGYGAEYPASAPGVIAVGGTSLFVTSSNTRSSEKVWNGAGSGCSLNHPKPSWQTTNTFAACGGRMEADVSAVADPNTGVAVYGPVNRKNSGWMVFGGTSASSPIIAALFALRNGSIQAASSIYANTANLYDVTQGSNGTCPVAYYCNGQVGYDGPSGLGTPNGLGAFSN
jgi:subtilase family serine protease